VSASAVIDGTIASKSGKAKAVPIPFKNVRRGKAFLVMNMTQLSSIGESLYGHSILLQRKKLEGTRNTGLCRPSPYFLRT
jgi:hypothetical protein